MNNATDSFIAIPAGAGATIGVAGKMPAIALFALGLIILYCVGFSPMAAAHNATHDTRHASGFPCH